MGTTPIDEDDRRDEDLNAIPDLLSNAVAEMVTAVTNEMGGCIPLESPSLAYHSLSKSRYHF